MGSIIGTIKRVGQTTTKGNYQFRELVLNTKEQYPQILSVMFSNDKCIALDKYNEGDHVEVQYNLRGREWTNPQGEVKVFNTIQAWKIHKQAEGVEAKEHAPDRADLPF